MKLRQKLHQLRKEMKTEKREKLEMVKVLQFYGDRENYSWIGGSRRIPVLDEDEGRRAREILKRINERKLKRSLNCK